MVIEPKGDHLLHRGKGILLRVSTGFAIEVMTGGFYSVKLPKLVLYQTELRPDVSKMYNSPTHTF